MIPKPKIATVGMFDGVHRGHRALLSRLKAEAVRRGGESWVFTFGCHPLTLIAPDKAPSPLMSGADKVAALKGEGIDGVEVLSFDEQLRSLTAEEFITLLHDRYGVSTLVMGFNHRFGRDKISDIAHYQEIGRRVGVEIVRADELRDNDIEAAICSSSIREAVARGDVKAAADMLGRPYAIHGKVVGGKQLGRKIGYPTANIRPTEAATLMPADGVYAVDVILAGGERHRGMLNIGVRPTVDGDESAARTIEVHIIDWRGELYGAELTVEFLDRLRAEQRFADIEALRCQLEKDKILASSYHQSDEPQ